MALNSRDTLPASPSHKTVHRRWWVAPLVGSGIGGLPLLGTVLWLASEIYHVMDVRGCVAGVNCPTADSVHEARVVTLRVVALVVCSCLLLATSWLVPHTRDWVWVRWVAAVLAAALLAYVFMLGIAPFS
jgi:hypothetical protein